MCQSLKAKKICLVLTCFGRRLIQSDMSDRSFARHHVCGNSCMQGRLIHESNAKPKACKVKQCRSALDLLDVREIRPALPGMLLMQAAVCCAS